jgi:hypothetical protein
VKSHIEWTCEIFLFFTGTTAHMGLSIFTRSSAHDDGSLAFPFRVGLHMPCLNTLLQRLEALVRLAYFDGVRWNCNGSLLAIWVVDGVAFWGSTGFEGLACGCDAGLTNLDGDVACFEVAEGSGWDGIAVVAFFAAVSDTV